MLTIKLDLATVKKNAKQAYDEGRLMAQHPEPDERECVYFDPVRPNCGCAIGVSFPPEMKVILETFQKGRWMELQLSVLASKSDMPWTIEVATLGELDELRTLQRYHDSWCNATRHNNDPNDCEERFLELLK